MKKKGVTSCPYEYSKRIHVNCVYQQFTFFREHGPNCLVALSQCHQPGQEQWVLGISLLSEPYLPKVFHLQFSDLCMHSLCLLSHVGSPRGCGPSLGPDCHWYLKSGTRNVLALGIRIRDSFLQHSFPATHRVWLWFICRELWIIRQILASCL